MFLVPFFDPKFILLVRTVPFLRKIIFISSYTAKNNYFFTVRTNTRFTVVKIDNLHNCFPVFLNKSDFYTLLQKSNMASSAVAIHVKKYQRSIIKSVEHSRSVNSYMEELQSTITKWFFNVTTVCSVSIKFVV